MAVRIRLARIGRIHRPYYRIVAIDGRCAREGETNEILGTYDPLKAEKNIEVQAERLDAWVQKGALVSEALGSLLKHHGYAVPAAKRTAAVVADKAPAKDGKKWVKPTRRAVRKHAAKLKAERKVVTAAAVEAAKAAKAAAAPAADAPQA
jgi:small subunit ribosomal protein S16